MLVKLVAKDISKWWSGISEGISRSLPPFTKYTKDRMSSILKCLMEDTLHCWVLTQYDSVKNTTIMYAIVTTEFTVDTVTITKNLTIFSLYALQPVPEQMWKDGFDTLAKFAKANHCNQILAFSDIPQVINIVNKLGGDTSTTLIKMEI